MDIDKVVCEISVLRLRDQRWPVRICKRGSQADEFTKTKFTKSFLM